MLNWSLPDSSSETFARGARIRCSDQDSHAIRPSGDGTRDLATVAAAPWTQTKQYRLNGFWQCSIPDRPRNDSRHMDRTER